MRENLILIQNLLENLKKDNKILKDEVGKLK